MHAIFMPYGLKRLVDMLIREMESQKFQMRCYKEGEPDKYVWLEAQVRILPGGLMEYVFPKEHADIVLTTLRFHGTAENGHYSLNKEIKIFGMKIRPLDYLKKILRIEDIPKIKTDKTLVWSTDNVSIIPIGVRYDKEVTEKSGPLEGYTHEAI